MAKRRGRRKKIKKARLILWLILVAAAVILRLWEQRQQTPAPVTLPEGQMGVHFLPVGNADACLLKAGEVEILIDGGETGDGELVASAVAEACTDGTLELLIATHAHADHIGGLSSVFEAVEVSTVVDSGYDGEGSTWESYRTARDREGAEILRADMDRSIPLAEGLTVELLEPLCLPGDTNDTSVVARVVYGGVRLLFTGDAGTDIEEALDPEAVAADLLKAPHHGSRTGSGEAFLAAVDPEIIVIPAGVDNSYGHPHEEAVERMVRTGAAMYITLDEGVVLRTDGTSLWVESGLTYAVNG